jgi:RNA polymerase sigma-70 factor (ECF subfamily)
MTEELQDQSLFRRWREGDQEAARQIYERYVDQLLALAKRRISQRLARRVDAEDILQSVFRTFFNRARQGQFQVEDQDDLCKLLVRITLHRSS